MGSFLGVYFGALGTALMGGNLDDSSSVCRYRGTRIRDIVKCIVIYPLMAIETIFCVGRS